MKRRRALSRSPSNRSYTKRIQTTQVQCDATKITDLVDDCLFEVYKHLDFVDLASVSDGCERLRFTAKEFFSRSKSVWLNYPSAILTIEQLKHEPIEELLGRTAKVLRNFGASITAFDESHDRTKFLAARLNEQRLSKFSTKIIELLQNYCSESLIELRFEWLEMAKEMTTNGKPIFPQVKISKWRNYERRFGISLSLSKWFPALNDLLISTDSLMGRRQTAETPMKFKNLKKAILFNGWQNDSLRQFLVQNPQLKELALFTEIGMADFRVLELIGKHTKELEVLRLKVEEIFDQIDYSTTFNCFCSLTKLKCLEIREINCFYSHGSDVVRGIVSAGIPLKSLTVEPVLITPKRADRLLAEVIKLKSLETLDLNVNVKGKKDIIRICTQLDKLCELKVNFRGILNSDDILQVVKVATKLQWLYLRGDVHFEGRMYKQIKHVLGERNDSSLFILKIDEKHRKTVLSNEWVAGTDVELYTPWTECYRTWELAVCCHERVSPGNCSKQHAGMAQFPVRFKNKDILAAIEKSACTNDAGRVSDRPDLPFRLDISY